MRTDDIPLGLKDQSLTLGMEFTENDNFKSSEDFLNFPYFHPKSSYFLYVLSNIHYFTYLDKCLGV